MDQSVTYTPPEAPFTPKVSFKKIFEYWTKKASSGPPADRSKAEFVLSQVNKVPELRTPFADLELLSKYQIEIDLLLSDIFSDLLQTNEIRTLSAGFNQVFFNQTQRFKDVLANAGSNFAPRLRGVSDDDFYLMGCHYVLQKAYGVSMSGGLPQILDIHDQVSGVTKTYRGFFNADFMELIPTPQSPRLSDTEIANLLDNADNVEMWKKFIPPGSFEMHGFGIMTLFDISADDAISQLKNILISKDALLSKKSLSVIQQSLRKLLRVNDLTIGLSAFVEGDFYNKKIDGFEGILMSDFSVANKDQIFCDQSYQALFRSSDALFFSDVDLLPESASPLLENLHKRKTKSYFIAPLTFDEKPVGYFEMGSRINGTINSSMKRQLQDLLPLFSTALKRSIDDYYNSIEKVIKEKCTAIHPTVEWRFKQAAARMLKQDSGRADREMEEIVFEKVMPLFGQLDIRGSSKHRNESIRLDLGRQLQMAKAVLQEAKKDEGLLAFDQLSHLIDKLYYKISDSLGAGDEASILGFISDEIDPVFDYIANRDQKYPALVQYLKRIDPKLHMIYEKRKEYEETVTLINDTMGIALDEAQEEAQGIFPHYFERYKTDGIEYNAYIGQSLVGQLDYNPIHLKSLQLWQLITMCDIDFKVNRLKSTLLVPLEVAPLILVQDTPLDIKFRMDEKRFDVDGTYNVRYEIIKKRIDKAHIKGSSDRLTQPGMLAVVYSNRKERNNYLEYFDFLISKSYILTEVEDLELEEMDGAAGLHSLRVKLNYDRELAKSNRAPSTVSPRLVF